MFSERSWASSTMIVSYCVEEAVALRLGQQDAVGHQLDEAFRAAAILEADLVADRWPSGVFEFLGDARGDRAGGDAPRLRVADEAGDAAAHLQADLRQLRRLARAGLAADDDHLVLLDGAADLVAVAPRSAALRDS